jgi:hypothetical protein
MFEVNSDLKVKIKKIEDYTWKIEENGNLTFDHQKIEKMIFIIDNFYENPDEVRKFALTSEFHTEKDILAGAIGRRVWNEDIDTMNSLKIQLRDVFSQLCLHSDWHIEYDKNHHFNKWECMRFVVNVTNNQEIINSNRDWKTICHIDGPYNKWASLVYLNLPEECEGGTAFYSVVPPDSDGAVNLPKLEYTCKMKYNRLVLYDANQIHGAIMESDMFKTCDRLSQVMFF